MTRELKSSADPPPPPKVEVIERPAGETVVRVEVHPEEEPL